MVAQQPLPQIQNGTALSDLKKISDGLAREKLEFSVMQAGLSHNQAISQMHLLSNVKRSEQAVTSLLKVLGVVHELAQQANSIFR